MARVQSRSGGSDKEEERYLGVRGAAMEDEEAELGFEEFLSLGANPPVQIRAIHDPSPSNPQSARPPMPEGPKDSFADSLGERGKETTVAITHRGSNVSEEREEDERTEDGIGQASINGRHTQPWAGEHG